MKKYILPILSLSLFPLFTSAQGFNLAGSTFGDVISYIIGLINLLIPILFALTFIIFFWGLSKYVIGAGDEKVLKQGKEYMMWGILVLFILTSYMAIIGIATSELDFGAPSATGSLLP